MWNYNAKLSSKERRLYAWFCFKLLLDLIIIQIRSYIWNSLFIKIKRKEDFRHIRFHHERDVEGCMISRMPELRESILLSSHQVLFLILRGDERLPRERLGHYGVEVTLPMIYIASKNPNSTHHRSRLFIDNTSFTRINESYILI